MTVCGGRRSSFGEHIIFNMVTVNQYSTYIIIIIIKLRRCVIIIASRRRVLTLYVWPEFIFFAVSAS